MDDIPADKCMIQFHEIIGICRYVHIRGIINYYNYILTIYCKLLITQYI